MKEIFITEQNHLRQRMQVAWDTVCEMVKGGELVVTIQRLSKTRKQEKHYHALIRDIAHQVRFPKGKYSTEVWKALLVDLFEKEMKRLGTPLSHPGKLVPSLDGENLVSIRASTKEFRKHEAADFIEFLHCQGIEMGVRFGSSALKIYEHYKEAA